MAVNIAPIVSHRAAETKRRKPLFKKTASVPRLRRPALQSRYAMPSCQVALKLLVLLACHTYPSILLLPVSAPGREHLRKSRRFRLRVHFWSLEQFHKAPVRHFMLVFSVTSQAFFRKSNVTQP